METASLEETVREPKAGGFLFAIGGPQFLAAQIFTVLATILGVYLAGYVGFQRTLEYDRFVKAQQRSDLLTAAQEELKQNIARLHKFNERLPAEVGTAVTSSDWPRLRLFVWQAAGRSASVFDVPPQILTDLRRPRRDVERCSGAGGVPAFERLKRIRENAVQGTAEHTTEVRRDLNLATLRQSHRRSRTTRAEVC
jgi:hypothetical protein